jgi:MFS family permease
LLGAAIGSLTCGSLVKFGKKNCIHGANLLLTIGCALTLIKVIEVVAVGRFLFGLAAGSFTVFVPSFINELTPTELKGPFGASMQILITLGILIANLLGIPLPDTKRPYEPGFVGDDYWRLLFALPIVLAVI